MAEVHSIHIKVDSTEANTASRNLNQMTNSANGAETALRNLTRAAVGLVALDQIGNVAKGILETNRAMEALRAQLVSVTGSAIGSQRAFKFIQDFATSTPYEVEGLTKAFITLQNYGIKPTQQVMEAVTNQASKLGASQETLDGIVRALGQAYAKGKLQAEEMLQLAERGVPVYDLLAQATGKNASQLQDMASKGELTRATIERLIATMGNMAAGSNVAAMDTLNGKISNLSDAWHQFEDALLNDKSEGILKSIVDGITGQINKMTNAMKMTDVQVLEGHLAKLKAMPGYDVPIAEVERKLALARKAEEEQKKISDEQNKIEDARVAKAEEAKKKLLGSGDAVVKSKKEQTAATKALHEAESAFTSTLEANIKVAQNHAKILDAQAQTAKMRLDNELAVAEEKARMDMKNAQSYEDKLKISSDLQSKQQEIIIKESELRKEAQAREEEILAVRIKSLEQEIQAADKFNMTQSERIRLQTELESLQTQQQIMPEQRTQIELDTIRQLTEASRQYNEIRAEGETNVREEALRTLEVLSSNLDYARQMASGLSEAFGTVGESIGAVSISLAEYAKQQATISIQAQEDIKKNPAKKFEIEDQAMRKQSQLQIKTYGDMTQAAQGFFKKGTKGYEALGTATKVFRAFEMAQSAMSMAKQISEMGGFMKFFTESLTQMGIISSTQTAATIAENETKAVSEAAVGAAHQGTSGDPYTAFARVAAWVALMAGLGIAISGGGGGSTAAPAPAVGSGTVKGDPAAVSESISKSLAMLVEVNTNDLAYSADMLDALKAIESALTGASELIAQKVTPLIDSVVKQFTSNSLLSSSQVTQAGFIGDQQSLKKVLQSGMLQGYMAARIESKTGLLGEWHSGKTLSTAYGSDIAGAFGKIVKTIFDEIQLVGGKIGVTADVLASRMKGLSIGLGKIDLAGKSAEESAKLIEAAFSSMSDKMAKKLIPEFKDFQKSGEGYFETINRVSAGIASATGSLELLGMEAISYSEITKKQADVAAEITRQTIMAQGDLTAGTKKYVDQLTGSSDDIIAAYKQILNVTNLMRGAGFNVSNIDRTMINAAGGLTAFEEAMQSFRDNFMTDEQKVAASSAELTTAFGKLGFELPKSKEDFYQLAMGINTSTDAGKKLFAQFILLNGQFSDFTDSYQNLINSQNEAATAAHDKLISELQKNVDDAFSAMQKSYQDLQKVQDRFLAISKNLRAYLSELAGGSMFMSPEQRYRTAKAEFERISALAATGNESALGQLSSAGKTFLDASKDYNASSTQFQSDFMAVTRTIESSAQYAESQVDITQKQLNVAEAAYNQLKTLDTSVLTVADAVKNLTMAMTDYAAKAAALAAAPPAPVVVPVVLPTPTTVATGSTGTASNSQLPIAYDSGYLTNIGFGASYVGPTLPKYASGGVAYGLGIAGENGPELVNFGSAAEVSSTGATARFFEGLRQTIAEGDADQTNELKALVNAQSAANPAILDRLQKIEVALSRMERTQKLNA